MIGPWVLWGGPSFRHGVHPEASKEATNRLPIERMPFVERYVVPMSQHTGAPAVPVVRRGERVHRGQIVGRPHGYLSVAVHAPVTGVVEAVEPRPHPTGTRQLAVVIRADPFDPQRAAHIRPADPRWLPREEILRRIQLGGLVGLGGAAFPTHVKLDVPEGKRVRFVVLNGCECEPYLTCDHRLMVERRDAVVRGLRILMQVTGCERGYIGIEADKPDAIEALQAEARDDPRVEVVSLRVKYPQGAERMLIETIFHREVPSGKLPLDLEILVQNVATAAALADLFDRGQPLIERVVTAAGDGLRRAANLLVPIGTPLADVVEHCGGLREEARQVILGGPMMGQAQKTLEAPIVKGTSGVLAFSRPLGFVEEDPCIRCGRCLEACPMILNPSRLAALARQQDVEALERLHALDCFECGSCAYVCPSHIPLVQLIRVGKALVRQARRTRQVA